MQPAITWDESSSHHGPGGSVQGRLRERAAAMDGGPDASLTDFRLRQMRPTNDMTLRAGSHVDSVAFTVAAFVFALPDSTPARQLRRRRDYFDARTGDTWDVFFPGYFRYGSMADPKQEYFDDYWGFSPRAFDDFRKRLEIETHGRWRFSGGADLVLLNVALSADGLVTVDHESVASGPLTDPADETRTLSLGQVIERISTDLESGMEDGRYGVREVVATSSSAAPRGMTGDTFVAAIGATLGAIGSHILGL